MRYSSLSATLASGAILLGTVAFAQNQPAPSDRMAQPADQRISTMDRQPLAFPPGFVEKKLNEVNDIKSELATLTKDAVAKDHFDNLINNLAKQDKTRLSGDKKRDVTVLNGRIDQIQKAWREKYGKDFDLDRKIVFDDRYAVLEGEISDPALALNNWPVPATSAQAMQASQRQQPAVNDANMKKAESEAKLEKGRNAALVQIPNDHNLPSITASLIHELPDQWCFDIPNDRSGEQIYNSLLNHLTYFGDHVDQWPADVNDAYRVLAHHAVAALYGVEVEMPGSNMPRP